MLEDVRVVDFTIDIAGPYCTKLLVDAGADVVKVEDGDGDPLRHRASGGLFEFLNASKRSVPTAAGEQLVDRADIVVASRAADVEALRARRPQLVVVTVTPFGYDGPWAGRPATEFTLQAWCGSTGSRGLPEEPPLAAGGRLGEWLAGTYAAVGALGALLSARRSGQGEHVDVALLDCMTVAMTTFPSVFAELAGWPPLSGTGRSIEVPSIEASADGYVVFTTNSAQQFADFLVLIGRADLADDTALARALTRFKRRDSFLAAVRERTTKRSSAELLAEAGLLRIPAGPVLNGETVPAFEQFVAREVFVTAPSGRFRQPRVPYRLAAGESRPFGPAPAAAGQSDGVDWHLGRQADPTEPWQRPLAGLRVIDCTGWWAGPAATHGLACLGADVIKVESAGRPDGMRFATVKPPSEDRWWEWGALFHAVNVDKRGVTLDLARPDGVSAFEQLLATADIFVENYTPRVMDNFDLSWERVHRLNPKLIMVRMPAFGLGGPWRDRTGFAQTMESVTGMAWLTGWPDGDPVLVRGACDPLAGMHAVFATLLAVAERHRTGEGLLVEVPMVESALNAAADQVIERDAAGALLSRAGNRGPDAAPQGVYRCAGDDHWVAIAVATDEQWTNLRSALGDPSWAADGSLASADGRRVAHDRIDGQLGAWTAEQDAAAVAERLLAAGVPAAVVIPARDVVDNPQLQHRRLFEPFEHPVTGPVHIPGLPMRFSRVERWAERPAPTIGQHNDQVLGEVLSAAELARLRADGTIADRPAGL